jgi:hypothetical protein
MEFARFRPGRQNNFGGFVLTSIHRYTFRMSRFFLLLAFILLAASACAPAGKCNGPQSSGTVLHVLFIGNSYTFVNDLPATFAKLACFGGHKVETGMAAVGGWTLGDHLASAQTLDQLKPQKWDVVILQEQSEIPAIPAARLQSMYPAARQLVAKIKAIGAQPLFFLTWGHRDGMADFGIKNFSDMQAQLDVGYKDIADELHVTVVPVGYAWLKARIQSNLNLWQDDGSHPNESGTYLAASVFYATLFHETPAGLSYTGGLSQDSAQFLQALAADTVLKGSW